MLPIFYIMKRIISSFVVLLLSISISYSQGNDVEVSIKLSTKKGFEFDSLKLGINKDATNGHDEELSEDNLPPMHPPTGLHAMLRFVDEQSETYYSYRDYRAIPDKDTFHIRYYITTKFDGNDTLIIKWSGLEHLDSAIISDKGNFSYRKKMLPNDSLVVTNSFVDDFNIDIYYNLNVTSVDREVETNEIFVYPIPADDKFVIKGLKDQSKFSVYDETGKFIADYRSSIIDTRGYSPGTYFLVVMQNNSKIVKKIIINK